MKILQVCNKIPFPPQDGGSLAMNQLSESLHRMGHEVKILAMNTHKQQFLESSWTTEYRRKFKPELIFMDTRIKALDAVLNLFSDKSYNIERFYSEAFAQKLQSVLQAGKYDIIQMESLYVAPYLPLIRKYSRAKVVLRAHNVEHGIWERLAAREKNPLRKKYLKLLADRLKAYEESKLNDFDAIAAITPGDAAFFRNCGCIRPVVLIPFGIEIKPFVPTEVKPDSIFFIGAMDWLPNEESVRWVLDHMWDRLLDMHPSLHFYIAGRNMPRWLKDLNKKQVTVFPDIPDADAFMADKAILLAPYFSGGGMRVKFIEAMARKKTVITTILGAEGIEGRDGDHFLLAESEAGLLAVTGKAIHDAALREAIGDKARSLVANKYDSRGIAETLMGLYTKIQGNAL
jgi:glycosyltransferase involved in cell wall biosynthesis